MSAATCGTDLSPGRFPEAHLSRGGRYASNARRMTDRDTLAGMRTAAQMRRASRHHDPDAPSGGMTPLLKMKQP